MTPYIRWLIRRDMPEVLAIESASFPNPWTEDDFLRCLRQTNCIGMVAEDESVPKDAPSIRGFMVYELHKNRLHVLNLAVHPEFRRHGIGSKMLDKLKGKLNQRRSKITLESADWNTRSHLFFSRREI